MGGNNAERDVSGPVGLSGRRFSRRGLLTSAAKGLPLAALVAGAGSLGGVPAARAASPGQDSEEPEVQYTKYKGIKVSYYEYGPTDGPTVVVTGGWPWSSSSFINLCQTLAKYKIHVIRYDQRGSGKSGHPLLESDFSMPNLAGEFGAVIDAAAPGRHVTTFGEAWGAFIPCEYSETHPGRVSSLVSMGAPSFDLAQNALNKATLNIAKEPDTLQAVAAQWAGISYMFGLSIPVIPELLFATGAPTWILNAVTVAAQGNLKDYLKDPTILANYPTNAYDSVTGINKYKWWVRNRMLGHTAWTDLPIPHVRVFQLSQDFIETPVLVQGLADHTPDLKQTTIDAGHLDFGSGQNGADLFIALLEAVGQQPGVSAQKVGAASRSARNVRVKIPSN